VGDVPGVEEFAEEAGVAAVDDLVDQAGDDPGRAAAC
jgi:hypothetical protein